MLTTIRAGALEVAYDDYGPHDGPPVVLLHGFPYDVRAYDEVAVALAGDGDHVVVPYLRGYGPTRFLDPATPRSGQQAAIGDDLRHLLVGLDLAPAVLAGYDWGGRAACIVAALWPERVRGLVTCGGYNVQDIAGSGRPLPPEYEHRFWYQYYFHGERGREGLARYRRQLTRLLWELWSPTWRFTDDVFASTAESFDNPDFVDIVVHSYRHRFGLAPGDPALEHIESYLATRPVIDVPAIALLGADDGVDPPDGDEASIDLAGVPGFSRLLAMRVVSGAGHNLPQEQPDAMVAAVRELMSSSGG